MPEEIENGVSGTTDVAPTSISISVSMADNQFVQVAPLYDLLMTGVPYHDWVAYLKQLPQLTAACAQETSFGSGMRHRGTYRRCWFSRGIRRHRC